MKRDLNRLAAHSFDLVIIGGGVYGLAAAWEAASRGLDTALVEQNDFGQATSAASLKLIHGGLRYLQHLNLARMRGSILERRRMLKIAPHLVHPLPFVIPCYGHGMRGPEIMFAAMLANDVLSLDRNRGLDREHRILAGRVVSSARCRELIPGVPDEGLTGGSLFYDAQMFNSERLTLAYGQSATESGALLANYVTAVGFDCLRGHLRSVRVRDRFTGDELEVRGRMFLNMTGPWSDITLGLLQRPDPPRRVLRSKGVQIITRRIGGESAFGIESRERDSTALIARGGRNYFVTPWRGKSIIGTTDTLYEGAPEDFRITRRDVEDLRELVNRIFPAAELQPEDVHFWIGGMRPLGDEDTNPEHVQASHHLNFRDHRGTDGIDNLFSIVGVKYTIARRVAEQTVKRVFQRLRLPVQKSRTAEVPLYGGNITGFSDFVESARQRYSLSPQLAFSLAANHGSNLDDLLRFAAACPGGMELLPGSDDVLRAEVTHAVQQEMALKLSDAVMRRTGLGSAGHPGRAALEACADIMAEELGWDAQRRGQELEETEALYVLPEQ